LPVGLRAAHAQDRTKAKKAQHGGFLGERQDLMDFLENNKNTGICNTTRAISLRMTTKGQQRQDQNKANDKDDNFEQSEARAYSG